MSAQPATRLLRLAAAQYDVAPLAGWGDYEQRIGRWVGEAAGAGARLLLFPEYFAMELASLFGPEVPLSLARQLAALQEVLRDFLALFARLARTHGICIAAGSFPVALADGSYRNRCHLFHPDGSHVFQDKLQMTRFETEQWHIGAGETLKVFDTACGRIGINICYDAEFPLLARLQVAAGADLILVPSCTDTRAGWHRVRIGSRARALENQCFVAQSPTVGDAPWSAAVDRNTGAAAVFAPVDYGFPDDGVVAQGEPDRPQWVYADLDLAALAQVRRNGQVFNYRDWDGQARIAGVESVAAPRA
jgi:predicted amidohydrolase